jgi:hypothetical protein
MSIATLWKAYLRHVGRKPLREDDATRLIAQAERNAIALSRSRPTEIVTARAYWRLDFGRWGLLRTDFGFGRGWPRPDRGKIEIIGRWLNGRPVE